MKAAGLVRGAYHFGRPKTGAVAQARHFVHVVRPTHGDLQLVLDLETAGGKSAADVWAWTQAFIAEVKRLTGRPGIIYTGYRFWRDHVGGPKDNLDCPLWLAAYTHSTPLVPRAWSRWTFWQYSEKGKLSGVQGHVDQDYFRGTPAQLKSLAIP
jgi:GH25 family lysozyme M1 (1,4-beta-N-acetylmuramidase)